MGLEQTGLRFPDSCPTIWFLGKQRWDHSAAARSIACGRHGRKRRVDRFPRNRKARFLERVPGERDIILPSCTSVTSDTWPGIRRPDNR